MKRPVPTVTNKFTLFISVYGEKVERKYKNVNCFIFLCVGMPSFYNLITLNDILNPINMPHRPQCEVKGVLNS